MLPPPWLITLNDKRMRYYFGRLRTPFFVKSLVSVVLML